jgi:hypothetical protein
MGPTGQPAFALLQVVKIDHTSAALNEPLSPSDARERANRLFHPNSPRGAFAFPPSKMKCTLFVPISREQPPHLARSTCVPSPSNE